MLVGESNGVAFVEDLNELNLFDCRIYEECGHPKGELSRLLVHNKVFAVDGKLLEPLRKQFSYSKSDAKDVILIRELARRSPEKFAAVGFPLNLNQRKLYRYYCKITELIGALKNRQWAFTQEFSAPMPELDSIIEELEEKKEELLAQFEPYHKLCKELAIRGLGPRHLGGILITAHPNRFPSLSAYLGYIGFKANRAGFGNSNRRARALYYQFCRSTIMWKDPTYYPLYLKIKADLVAKHPDHPRYRIDRMARNRIATFLAKRIYQVFHSSSDVQGMSGEIQGTYQPY